MGNCCSSPASEPVAAEPVKPVVAPKAEEPALKATNGTSPVVEQDVKPAPKAVRIAIIYYSTYGHIAAMAKKVLAGANSIPGVTAELFQVAETLPQDVLEKMHAPPKDASVPVIDVDLLPSFDGFIFGFPTRFGTMCAQFKTFLDSTGGLWAKGALVGKGASIFTSNGTQGGGSESTVFTSIAPLVHHGMVFIPTGYTLGERLYDNGAVRGGTAYGASTLAGADGSRQPSELELDFAEHQGSYVAGVIKKLAAV